MIETIKDIVTEAGKQLSNLRNSKVFAGEWKGTQFKAEADLLLHNCLVNHLKDFAPDIPIISEEDPESWKSYQSEEFFIIDPIDGTASFIQGFEGFVTQVAYVKNAEVECSAICVPVTGDIFSAVRNQGAFLNTKQLKISDPDRWLVLVDNYPEPRGITGRAFRDLGFENYVESGSISLKICKIAEGTADIFFKNVPIQQWDVAAPYLILKEAGGVLWEIHGNEISYRSHQVHPGIVAANSERNAKRLIAWYSNLNTREDFS